MVATIYIDRLSGVADATRIDTFTTTPTTSDTDAKTGFVTTHPIPIPDAPGYNNSYWVPTRLRAHSLPVTEINNIKWFTDGVAFLADVFCQAAVATTYVAPTGVSGKSGATLVVGNYASINTGPTGISGVTAGTPLGVSGSITGAAPSVTGGFGDYVVYQVRVNSTAVQGPTTLRTFTWQYDET